jgi:hypothetical protein
VTDFIAPRYELPLVDPKNGIINREWYKFFVPLARKAVSNTISINTTAPVHGGGNLATDLTLSLDANGVTNAFLAKMAATTIKGNSTGASATPQDLTAAQVTALLNVFTSVLNGLVPSSGGGTNGLLRTDGTWASSVGGSFTAGTFLKTATTVVASLPSAATSGAGARHMVTDALVPVFGNAVAGTGAVVVPVYSDGSVWRVG